MFSKMLPLCHVHYFPYLHQLHSQVRTHIKIHSHSEHHIIFFNFLDIFKDASSLPQLTMESLHILTVLCCAWTSSNSGHSRVKSQVGKGEHKDEGTERKETIKYHNPNKSLLFSGKLGS